MHAQIHRMPLLPGLQKAVSILLPTRGRPEQLGRALKSLADNAEEPGRVEVLLRVDDDDRPTPDFLKGFLPTYRLASSVITGPRGNGYLDIHHHHHDMARRAVGHWLMVFNDDSVMLTPGWDRHLDLSLLEYTDVFRVGQKHKLYYDDVWLAVPRVVENPGGYEVFAVTKKTFEVLGRLSANMGADIWLHTVFTLLHREVPMPLVEISHKDRDDQTFKEGRARVEGKLLHDLTASGRVIRGRLTDAMRLQDYIEECRERPDLVVECEACEDGLMVQYGALKGKVRMVGDHLKPARK